MITAQSVKELREKTGAGMMDCKKALTEANGDMEKAIEILREKGLAAAAKKAGRIAAEGLVKTYVSEDGKTAGIIELNCETDFVAANEEFVAVADRIAEIASKTSATTVEELANEKYDDNSTIQETLTALIAKLGENMTLRRFEKFSVEKGLVESYIHGGGRIGVVVELASDSDNTAVLKEVAKDLCMQVAAANPLFLSENDVDQTTLEKEKEIYRVGGITPIKVDVRIIAATNKDLQAMVQRGEFREDLFYRLNVVPIKIPPLRDRPEDILELAEVFFKDIPRFTIKPLKAFPKKQKKS